MENQKSPFVYLGTRDEIQNDNAVVIKVNKSFFESFKKTWNERCSDFGTKQTRKVLLTPVDTSIPTCSLLLIQNGDGEYKQAPIVDGKVILS